MIHLLTHLEGVPLSTPSIPPTFSVVPPPMPETTYGDPLISSRVSSSIPISTYGISCASVVSSFMPVSDYGLLSPGVQPSSMLPSQVGSQPAKFTIPPIV